MIGYNELVDILKSMTQEKIETYKEDFQRQDLYYIDPFLIFYTGQDKLDLLDKQYDQYHTMTKSFEESRIGFI